MIKERQQRLELVREQLRKSPQERLNLLKHSGYTIQEDSKIFKNDKYVGQIKVGQNHLLYFDWIRSTPDLEYLPLDLITCVDDIVLESNTHLYQCTSYRFIDMLSDIDNTLDQPYWESRHKGIEHLNPTEWKRRNLFGDNWYNLLKVAIDSDHMSQLGKNIASLRKLSLVYPSPDRVFRAYKMCPPTYTKVIIVGQNPYYQHGVADGLAFSYLDGKPQNTRKALDEILDEIERDVYEGFNVNKHYNLDYLAKQGVFLLNSALTVEYNQPDSHLDIGWQKFTAYTLKMLYTDYRPKVFMLWGTQASNLFKQAINTGGAGAFTEVPHLILTAKHPAYDVRLRNNDLDHYNKLTYPDTFKGCKHFSRANQFLISKGKTPIKWLDA